MDITFKVILDRIHPKKDSTLPLRLRIFKGRSYKEYSFGFAIPEKDWDEQLQQVYTSNSSHWVYNTKISSIKTKLQRFLLLNEEDEKPLTLEKIIEHLSQNGQKKSDRIIPDILDYGKKHIEKLRKAGHIGNSIVYSCAINKLKEFAGKEKLSFEEVTYSYIEKLNTALLSEGMKVNGVANYLRTIRAVFNKAIKEGIISADCYPFSKYQIKHEKTINRTLTLTEIRSIINLDLAPGTTIWHHRNLFLLSYYLMGINFSDLLTLTKDSIVDGRIVFRRRKTHKVYSIWLHPKAEEILNHYRATSTVIGKAFLLPFVTNKNDSFLLKKDILQAVKNTNDYLEKIAKLCDIDKPITTYYARYTWANVARGLGYSKDIIAEGLGHEYGNKVTGIYLDHYSNRIIDEMNAEIINKSFS